ncbi:MAG: bifunctional anthranilate synthase component II/anthranilate phosphoribosyltransferase [Oscillospiraceae bacterium]|nr:bifunctional anthranilate synthase component II/anthranilate phosphoribosyltransferase [Oscillospiraceae bacterium]
MIVMIDNYDSFTYNLYQLIGTMYEDIKVFRNDAVTIEELEAMNPEALIISPGPGYPADAGISIPAIKHFATQIPILGVCLGHQAIVEAFGGKIVKASQLMHGKSSMVTTSSNSELFAGLPEQIKVARYHSLISDSAENPDCLHVTARDENGQIMAVEHRVYKVFGVQFHPESILTPEGAVMIENFLKNVESYGKQEKAPAAAPAPAAAEKTELKKYISKVADRHEHLTEDEAHEAMLCIMNGGATDAQIAALLTAMKFNGESIDEITGFAKGMREMASEVTSCSDAIDIVGTGGDMSNTFNISTTSSFVISACGAKVAKHGNRSVSSKSGAADILESVGVKIASTPEEAKKYIDTIGLSFLFAQSYHSSMRFVAPARKQLGIKTVFNILGPLTNPAKTDYIVLGTYSKDLLRPMAEVLIKLGIKRAMLVYGTDCLDEISISAPTAVCEIKNGEISEYELTPEDFGFKTESKDSIVGGTPTENADTTLKILSGTLKGPKRNIVVMNSAAALYTAGKAASLKEGVKLAEDAIDSGKALEKLNQLIKITNGGSI